MILKLPSGAALVPPLAPFTLIEAPDTGSRQLPAFHHDDRIARVIHVRDDLDVANAGEISQ